MKQLHVVAGVIRDAQGRVLLASRTEGRDLAGLWEFPGGKVEPGETPDVALARELRPALVVLDVMLPGSIDGLEVCRRLRADPSQAGVKVLLSARGLPADLQAGRRAGADACLVKPCSPIDLLEQIESMLG